MTRTNPWLLVLLAIAGGVVTWAIEVWLTSTGGGSLVPSIAFAITLIVMAVVVLAIAWPVRRYTAALRKADAAREASLRSTSNAKKDASFEDADAATREVAKLRVDPFRATFAVALAKAASLAGSVFLGGSAAVIVWLTSRTVMGSGVTEAVIAAVASALLVIAGLIAESWCSLPPSRGESDTASAAS
ncbi:DUF3180 domain-containing protein [Gulosibacter chungangensis]|uniref:DUF3180 domain-containing protein n=1 Tax=Gulosibacter chungangensis TaxID=979746 RepID=A0A7J5B7I8_9MICO|nr:DUF3180 domain-containing protein [Gulosibacter chungangensis]KAB1640841.1 DUF3180 domain-containing protein [Gulosibacter chungangensis]